MSSDTKEYYQGQSIKQACLGYTIGHYWFFYFKEPGGGGGGRGPKINLQHWKSSMYSAAASTTEQKIRNKLAPLCKHAMLSVTIIHTYSRHCSRFFSYFNLKLCTFLFLFLSVKFQDCLQNCRQHSFWRQACNHPGKLQRWSSGWNGSVTSCTWCRKNPWVCWWSCSSWAPAKSRMFWLYAQHE